jgi:Rad3-related DNA helicase
MALTVSTALDEGRVALIEAGTGTGKSLAYLVPAFLFASRTGERVVISTHTKNLQDQLFSREIPLLQQVLPVPLRVARLMGRENYICSKRTISVVTGMQEDESGAALALAIGAALAPRGTVDSITGACPRGVMAAPPRCRMGGCGLADRCPLVRARTGSKQAAIILVNHALLLTDYRQGDAVIGLHARVIIDEAHHLERSLIENLSVRAGRGDVDRLLEPLRPIQVRDDRWRYLLSGLEYGQQGVLAGAIRSAAAELLRTYEEVFSGIGSTLNGEGLLLSTRTRYVDGEATFADCDEQFNRFLLNINKLSVLCKPLLEGNETTGAHDFREEVTVILEELDTLAEAVRLLRHGQEESRVFWLEWTGDGSLGALCGSPLEVDRLFADYLEERHGGAVLTSATLTHDGSFGHVEERLGIGLLGSEPLELRVRSPFPYDRNCLILVAGDLGNPNDEAFAGDVADVVTDLAIATGRRMIILFTSYRLCRETAELLAVADLPGPVLVQGAGESREAMADRLRASENGMLLGVASFWEGVDFPGEELQILVIPKLPFPVPSEPIVEARAERLRSLGEDPFEKLFVPEAALRLKQGVGRLIRRCDDRGVVVILDSRLGSRPYGRAIMAALPTGAEMTISRRIAARTATWFEER